jgi:hypothetical protein
MDYRVVVAARAIAPKMLVRDGVRKIPLRAVAGRYMSPAIAQYEKKAMQYGSGVMKEILRQAARKGYKRSLQDYLLEICKKEGRVSRQCKIDTISTPSDDEFIAFPVTGGGNSPGGTAEKLQEIGPSIK